MPNNQNVTRQSVLRTINNKHPNAPPPHTQQNNAVQPIDTADAPVCYYHQTFGDKGHPVFARPRRLAPDKLVTRNASSMI